MEEKKFEEFVESMKALFRRHDLQVTGRLTIRDNIGRIPIDFDGWCYMKSQKNDFMLFLDKKIVGETQ